MAKPPDDRRLELLQGTLDMLILRTLQWGPQHGANQRAKYYRLTAAGKAQLSREQDRWSQLAPALEFNRKGQWS